MDTNEMDGRKDNKEIVVIENEEELLDYETKIEEEEGAGERQFEFPFYKVLLLVFASLALITQITAVVLYMTSVGRLYGKNMTILNAINLIFELFEISSGRIYRTLVSCGISIVYFVIFVLMIIGLCRSVSAAISIVKHRKALQDQIVFIRFKRIVSWCMFTYELIGIFMVSLCLVGGISKTGQIVSIFVMAGIAFVGKGVVIQFFSSDSPGFVNILLDVARDSLVIAGFSMLLIFMSEPAVKETFDGLIMLFSGGIFSKDTPVRTELNMMYTYLISPIFYVIMACFFLTTLHEYFYYSERGQAMTRKIKKALIITASFMIVHLVFKCSLGVSSFDMVFLNNCYQIVKKSYLPMLLLYGLLFVLEQCYKKVRRYD